MKTNKLIPSLVLTAMCLSLSVQADVVTDWNSKILDAIRTNRTGPPVASRQLAILHASIYDAVNGITRRYEPYRVRGNVAASASVEAAAVSAARRVMVTFYPAAGSAYDGAYNVAIAALGGNRPNVRKGTAWGEQVAQNILAWRATDGWNAVVEPLPALGIGDWLPTPAGFAPFLLPQWGFMTPFAMSQPSQFRPPGPPALSSEEWAVNCNEVKALGAVNSTERTADQTEIALFWADGGGTETPPGHWNSIAQDVGGALRNSMEENARLFALLNIAMADAAIAAWDAKYIYHNWRPITAIRNADQDGNDGTEPDPTWAPLIATPPFPDYVSGHSTFSGAAATVLAMFYGTDDIAFTTGSDFLPGVLRSFTSFSGAAEEAMSSRLYGGIHYRFANEDGMLTGQNIGEWTSTRYLRPAGNRGR